MNANTIGIAAGVLTAVSMMPQVIKTIREKKAADISPFMLLLLMTGLALWVWYGCVRKDWPLILTNAFSFLLNSAMLILRLKYGRK
jgi:MtN3 and saliva related transmembrane protein